MNKQQQALLIVIVCIAILLITTSMIYIRGLAGKNENLKTQNAQLKVDNVELRQEIEQLTEDINEINEMYQKEIDRLTGTYIGTYKATFYCYTGNRTASGTWPEAGRTVATDPSVIPTGSEIRVVYPDGKSHIYTAEDTGGSIKGRILDVYVDSRKEALQLGVKQVRVYLIKEAIK